MSTAEDVIKELQARIRHLEREVDALGKSDTERNIQLQTIAEKQETLIILLRQGLQPLLSSFGKI
jgi:non-ribosomal peptide synthetase component E (peptide arylation enzyme)